MRQSLIVLITIVVKYFNWLLLCSYFLITIIAVVIRSVLIFIILITVVAKCFIFTFV